MDIDIITKAFDDTAYTLVCECKFGRDPIGFATLNTPEQRCRGASIKENVRYILFSANDPRMICVNTPTRMVSHRSTTGP